MELLYQLSYVGLKNAGGRIRSQLSAFSGGRDPASSAYGMTPAFESARTQSTLCAPQHKNFISFRFCAGGRIRTCEGLRPGVLQTPVIVHSTTPACYYQFILWLYIYGYILESILLSDSEVSYHNIEYEASHISLCSMLAEKSKSLILEPEAGFEPATCCLQNSYSTAELLRQKNPQSWLLFVIGVTL